MKNRVFFGTLICSLLLTGCNNNSVEKSLTPLQENIENLKKGFTFAGNLTQTRNFYTDYTFTTIDNTGHPEEDLKNEASMTFYFGKDAARRVVEVYDILADEYYTYMDVTYIADEEGYIYKEYLTYSNTVGRNYEMDGFNKISLSGIGLDNPFNYISDTDIVKMGDGTYELNAELASFIFSRLCSFFVVGASGNPQTNTVAISSDNKITGLYFEPAKRYVADYVSATDTYVYYTVDSVFDFTIMNTGEDKIERLSPTPNKGNINKSLENAISKFNGNNVTMFTSEDTFTSSGLKTSSRNIFIDGENVFVKEFDNSGHGSESTINSSYDYLLTKNPNRETYEARGYDLESEKWYPSNNTRFGKVGQDKYFFNDLIPSVSGLSADLFTYDQDNDEYVLEGTVVNDIGKNLFQASATELSFVKTRKANQLSIFLNGDEEIESVTFFYDYVDFLDPSMVSKGQISIYFQDFGNTELPFGISDNLGE